MIIKRLVLAALVLLNVFLAYRLFLGDNGIRTYLEIKNKHAEMEEAVSAAEDRSMELSREIRMLKSDDEYLADTIRKRMNYVKDGELLYLTTEKKPEGGSSSASGAGADENEN
jgi:cell division protein FtsB